MYSATMDPAVLSRARSALDRLEELLPSKGRVLIVPHDYPDPDALASAAAVHLLLDRRWGLRGQIVFSGEVSRAENRELLRYLKYRWRYLSQLREPRKKVPCFFIDTAPWYGNVTVPSFAKPVAVIDHHPVKPASKSEELFTDIRTGRGATAAIVTEYLVAAEVNIPQWMATILAYAIATETLDLSRGSSARDLNVYTSLLLRANLGALGRIRHAALPRNYYARLKEAMSNGATYGRVAWTHLNEIQEPEIVAELAELLLRMERITWAFCTAYSGQQLLISLRSSVKTARCGTLLKSVINKHGSGGGHHRMAAGSIEVGELSKADREALKDDIVKSLLAKIEPRIRQTKEPLGLVAQPLVES